jgi:hypothetical protein
MIGTPILLSPSIVLDDLWIDALSSRRSDRSLQFLSDYSRNKHSLEMKRRNVIEVLVPLLTVNSTFPDEDTAAIMLICGSLKAFDTRSLFLP